MLRTLKAEGMVNQLKDCDFKASTNDEYLF